MQTAAKRKKILKSDDSLRNLSNIFKWNSICIIGVPEERRERENGAENLFEEIMSKSSLV